MRKAIISIPGNADEEFYRTLFEKMGVKVRFLSDEEMEDIILGKMIEEGKTGKRVSEEVVLKELHKNGH